MGVVVFNPDAFRARYPQFSADLVCASDAALTAYFNEATLYLSNTDCSVVQNLQNREMLLWMLTAHIAYLNGALSPDGSPPPVGRVSSATEGSVSVNLDYIPATPGSGAWFNQTAWGAQFWQATSSLRGFRYRARPTVVEGQYGRPFRGC